MARGSAVYIGNKRWSRIKAGLVLIPGLQSQEKVETRAYIRANTVQIETLGWQQKNDTRVIGKQDLFRTLTLCVTLVHIMRSKLICSALNGSCQVSRKSQFSVCMKKCRDASRLSLRVLLSHSVSSLVLLGSDTFL